MYLCSVLGWEKSQGEELSFAAGISIGPWIIAGKYTCLNWPGVFFSSSFLEVENTSLWWENSASVDPRALILLSKFSVNSKISAKLRTKSAFLFGMPQGLPGPVGLLPPWYRGEERVGITLCLPRLRGEFQPPKDPSSSPGTPQAVLRGRKSAWKCPGR